jgi:hypothetical protein
MGDLDKKNFLDYANPPARESSAMAAVAVLCGCLANVCMVYHIVVNARSGYRGGTDAMFGFALSGLEYSVGAFGLILSLTGVALGIVAWTRTRNSRTAVAGLLASLTYWAVGIVRAYVL